MAKKQATKKEMTTEQKIGVGVGLTAAAVAAAGAYFLYGSEKAEKNRKAVKSWALKAKAEVLEKLEDAKAMSQNEYEDLIAAVAGTYASAKGATKKDLKEFAAEMTEHWHKIEKAAGPKVKKAKKAVAKVKKAATKKAAPKKTVAKKASAKKTTTKKTAKK